LSVSYDDAVAVVRAFAGVIADHKDELTELDSAIGDADHGINMNRGMQAALEVVDGLADGDGADGDVGAMFKAVGMKLVSTVGGAGGPLYGTLFLQLGVKSAGKAELEPADWLEMLTAAVDGVIARGKAELEDKTMVDALVPARGARDGSDRSAGRAEGTGELPRRAERRPSGPRRDVVLPVAADRRRHVGRRMTDQRTTTTRREPTEPTSRRGGASPTWLTS
jgi:dihydroxyacetone kinase-like protein